jgi:hypothetical protein
LEGIRMRLRRTLCQRRQGERERGNLDQNIHRCLHRSLIFAEQHHRIDRQCALSWDPCS